MRRILLSVACLAIGLLLVACGSKGPPRRVHPSTASVQQMQVQDGKIHLSIRIHNFSTMPMHYSRLQATFSVDGEAVGEIELQPALDIVANGGDVVQALLQAPGWTPPEGDSFAYLLKGEIETSSPKARFNIEHSSRLSPVPGIAGTYR